MRKWILLAILILTCQVRAADYYFYVGGMGDFSNSSDTNGGGAVSTIAMADCMGADGGPLAADTGATGTDATPSVISLGGTILSTASIADDELAGIFVYLSGTNCTTGVYRIQSNDSTADTITLYRNASSGGAMSALVVNVGGAFDTVSDATCSDGAFALIPNTTDIWDEEITGCTFTDSGAWPVTKVGGSPFANISAHDIVHVVDAANFDRRARVAAKPDDNTLNFTIDLGDAAAGTVVVYTNVSTSITVWCNRDFDGVGGNSYWTSAGVAAVRIGSATKTGGSIEYNQWIRLKGFRTTPGDMDKGGASYGDRIVLDNDTTGVNETMISVFDEYNMLSIENFKLQNMDKTTLAAGNYRIGIQPWMGDQVRGGMIRNCVFEDLQWGVSAMYNVSGTVNYWKPLTVVDCTAINCKYEPVADDDEGGGFFGYTTVFINCNVDTCHDGYFLRDGTVTYGCVAQNIEEAGFEIMGETATMINCVAYNCRDGYRPYFNNMTQVNMLNCIADSCFENSLRIGTLGPTKGKQLGSWGYVSNNIMFGGTQDDYIDDAFSTSPTWDGTAGTFIDDVTDDPRFIDPANGDFRRFGRLNRGMRTPGDGKTTIGAWQPNAITRPLGRRRALQGRYD